MLDMLKTKSMLNTPALLQPWHSFLVVFLAVILMIQTTQKQVVVQVLLPKKLVVLKSLHLKLKALKALKVLKLQKQVVVHQRKLTTLNKLTAALVSRLTQSQGWADGKLDENGNPTENGTPNPAYNWAKLITSIKYAENELTIYVNKDYAGLPKTQFASYMTRAENASLNALQEAGIIDDADVQKDSILEFLMVIQNLLKAK